MEELGNSERIDGAAKAAARPRKGRRVAVAVGISAVALIAIAVAALFATKTVCLHVWGDATCTEPQVCVRCARQQGEPLGHITGAWKTTTEPTCSAEGVRECTCERCGQKVTQPVEKLAHTEGQWAITTPFEVRNDGRVIPGEKSLLCSVCGEVIRTEEHTMELTDSQKAAFKSAKKHTYSYCSYLGLIRDLERDGFSHEDAVFAADNSGFDWLEQAVLMARSEKADGSSANGIEKKMTFYLFTEEQIAYALAQVGY